VPVAKSSAVRTVSPVGVIMKFEASQADLR